MRCPLALSFCCYWGFLLWLRLDRCRLLRNFPLLAASFSLSVQPLPRCLSTVLCLFLAQHWPIPVPQQPEINWSITVRMAWPRRDDQKQSPLGEPYQGYDYPSSRLGGAIRPLSKHCSSYIWSTSTALPVKITRQQALIWSKSCSEYSIRTSKHTATRQAGLHDFHKWHISTCILYPPDLHLQVGNPFDNIARYRRDLIIPITAIFDWTTHVLRECRLVFQMSERKLDPSW